MGVLIYSVLSETTKNAAGYTCDVLRPQEPVRQLIKLGRQVLPETIVQEHSPLTRDIFDAARDGPRILIAAYNEEGDLPTALLSLAMSDEPLHPIVVTMPPPIELLNLPKRWGQLSGSVQRRVRDML